jgi:hypothetical protein
MKTVLIFLVLVTSSLASANSNLGAAGCGLGSMVFKEKDNFSQILASTTNGSFGTQTFGISSGTSNCTTSGKGPIAFIETNKSSLKNDMAKGYGETVNSLAEIYGCKSSQQLGKTLQSNYKKVFSTEDATIINKNINTVIEQNHLECGPMA